MRDHYSRHFRPFLPERKREPEFKGYVAHRPPGQGNPKFNPDAWNLICTENTRHGAHDECARQIRGWNEGKTNPTLYLIHVVEVNA